MAGLVLIDNDALVLLAGSGHLALLLESIGKSLADCRRLPSFPHVFQKKIASRLLPSVAARVAALAAQIAPLELMPSAAIQDLLVAAHGIDVGEAVLYGVLAEHESILLTTNDKRSVRALCQNSTLATVRDAVAGRVLCLEEVVRKLTEEHGVVAVAPGFREVATVDSFLRVAFTDITVADHAQCHEIVNAYLNDLRSNLSDGFLHEL